jgi:hypothetical protein
MVLKNTLFLGFVAGAWASVRPVAHPLPESGTTAPPGAVHGSGRRPCPLRVNWHRDAAIGRLERLWRKAEADGADARRAMAEAPWSGVVMSRLYRAACLPRHAA